GNWYLKDTDAQTISVSVRFSNLGGKKATMRQTSIQLSFRSRSRNYYETANWIKIPDMYSNMAAIKLMVLVLLATFTQACSKKDAKDHNPTDDDLEVLNAKDVQKTNSMGLWAHYMPWFEDKASSGTGNWGMHWTMANRNPDLLNADGKRQIAAHYYPLIGPYASNDRDVLEYHFLLM